MEQAIKCVVDKSCFYLFLNQIKVKLRRESPGKIYIIDLVLFS